MGRGRGAVRTEGSTRRYGFGRLQARLRGWSSATPLDQMALAEVTRVAWVVDLECWRWQRFSSVVGPNGSGKSNVIDAMLFVFGKRAKQLRLNKVGAAAAAPRNPCRSAHSRPCHSAPDPQTSSLFSGGLQPRPPLTFLLAQVSELIHRSETHMDLQHCKVSVHFVTIRDKVGRAHCIFSLGKRESACVLSVLELAARRQDSALAGWGCVGLRWVALGCFGVLVHQGWDCRTLDPPCRRTGTRAG